MPQLSPALTDNANSGPGHAEQTIRVSVGHKPTVLDPPDSGLGHLDHFYVSWPIKALPFFRSGLTDSCLRNDVA